jgi:hypothetical protein
MVKRGETDAFDGSYSPRHIRFLLVHWQALASIAIDPAAGRGELDALRREWELVNTDATVMGVCACERRGFYRSTPAEYARGGGYRSEGAANVAVLLADLEHAADALPIHWRATAAIFHAQQRPAVWAARLATHRMLGMPRPQDRGIEPSDSGHRALGMMARTLGWRSDDEQRGVA